MIVVIVVVIVIITILLTLFAGFQVGVRSSSAGLGSDMNLTKSMDEPEVSQKEKARLKAQQRFAKILADEETP